MTLQRTRTDLDFGVPTKNQFDLQAVRERVHRLWESRKRAKVAASDKAPIVPLDENSNTPPELPKVGSRDAPGG